MAAAAELVPVAVAGIVLDYLITGLLVVYFKVDREVQLHTVDKVVMVVGELHITAEAVVEVTQVAPVVPTLLVEAAVLRTTQVPIR
jgi:hypothetical protein